MQPIVLKAGDSINDHATLYNLEKAKWMLSYGRKKFLPHHMKSVLVESWYAFKVSAGNIIRDSFLK